ncbi:MAG: hypothetical protein HRU09_13760 [Oligoflexales bacterium]|nr:hypothetical protein [Oligoflexales bacterium]
MGDWRLHFATATNYRLNETLVIGLNLGFGQYKGEAQFDNMDLDQEVSANGSGAFGGISFAFVGEL